jgi:hypothetical protein
MLAARTIPALVIAVVSCCWMVPAQAARLAAMPSYTPSAVGSYGAAYKPLVVNVSDQMVGVEPNGTPFYVDSGTVYVPPTPTGVSCWALTGLNSSGEVAGWEETGTGCTAPIYPIVGWISGASLTIADLEGPDGSSPAEGCSAVSANGSGTIVGMCDEEGTSYPALWKPSGSYGAPDLLSWPSGINGPAALDGPPPAYTRMVDDYGDVIALGSCADDTSVTVTVVWPYPNTTPQVLKAKGNVAPCVAPVATTTVTRAYSIAANVSGSGKTVNGIAYAVGACLKSGVPPDQTNIPCMWHLTFKKGKLTISAPKKTDANKGSRYTSLVDVNASGWAVGSEGDKLNTVALWVPTTQAATAFLIFPLASVTSGTPWGFPGSCGGPYGPTSINGRGDVVGVGTHLSDASGYLLSLTSYMDANARREASGTGCQE